MKQAQFVMRQYDSVYRYIAYRMHGSDAAADVTQEVFLKLCAQWSKEPPKEPKAYLYAIVRHEISEYYRHAREEEPATDDIPSEDDFSEDLAVKDSVRRALLGLPSEQREALVLRYLCDFSATEIAAALQIPLSTVKTRIRRGKAAMKDLMERRDCI